jgi:hypothetical protein
MTVTAESPLPASEPPVVIQPTRGLAALQVRALWHYRELLFFLVWRDVKVRYNPETARGGADRAGHRLDRAPTGTEHSGVQPALRRAAQGALERRAVPGLCVRRAGAVEYFAGSLNRVSTSLVLRQR